MSNTRIVKNVSFSESMNESTGYASVRIYGVVEQGNGLTERHHIGTYDPDVMSFGIRDFVGKTLSAARAFFSDAIRQELEFLGDDEDDDCPCYEWEGD
jgi:hypothetical protein